MGVVGGAAGADDLPAKILRHGVAGGPPGLHVVVAGRAQHRTDDAVPSANTTRAPASVLLSGAPRDSTYSVRVEVVERVVESQAAGDVGVDADVHARRGVLDHHDAGGNDRAANLDGGGAGDDRAPALRQGLRRCSKR